MVIVVWRLKVGSTDTASVSLKTRSCPALKIGIPQDTDNGCDVIVVLLIRLPPNLDSGLTS